MHNDRPTWANYFAMNDTHDSAAWCPICGEVAEVVQVSVEEGWSEAATHLVTIRACTNRYCEGHHPAVRQKVHATTSEGAADWLFADARVAAPAKVLSTLRSQALDPDLAATG